MFNPIGQLVETVVDDNLNAGVHEVLFNASNKNLSSGVYYYQLTTDSYSETKGMILLK